MGVDGSQPSREALRWAADEARLRQASLHVVMMWHTPVVAGYPYVGPAYDRPSSTSTPFPRPRTIWSTQSYTTGIPQVDRILTMGDAAATLLTASKDAALLVVGSRGLLGGFAGLLLGFGQPPPRLTTTRHSCPLPTIPPEVLSRDQQRGGPARRR